MKLIHSFLTNSAKKSNTKQTLNATNWGNTTTKRRVYWYCWAWSFLAAKKHTDNFELYTDSTGADILVGTFGLPYTKINLSLDHVDSKYMYLGKIKTYANQHEPFLHIDGDVVFRDYFPTNLEQSNLFGQHFCWWLKDLYMYSLVLLFNNKFENVPEEFKKLNLLNMKPSDYSYLNAGVFGGTDLQLIKQCSAKTLLFFENESNKKILDDLFQKMPTFTYHSNGVLSNMYTQTALFSLFEEFLPILIYKEKYGNLNNIGTVLNDNLHEEYTGEMHFNKSDERKYVHLMDLKRQDDDESVAYRERFIKKFREEYPEWADKIDKYLS